MLGIGLKVLSVCLFLAMSSLLKASAGVPVGQLVFFRSFFAILPIVIFLSFRRELFSGLKTKRPFAHLRRGLIGIVAMGLGFFALTQLPLPEAVAINFASPLIIVVLSALFLGEQVRVYRWSAVLVGLAGVMIIIWPRLTVFSSGDFSASTTIGALAALGGASVGAFAALTIRGLVKTERSATVVIYFSLIASIAGLSTALFGWIWPTPEQAIYLVSAGILGGTAQILMTESFRRADMSVIAPFDYISLPLSVVVGIVFFADIPTVSVLVGGAIVVSAGISIIYREHRLGLERAKARRASTPLA